MSKKRLLASAMVLVVIGVINLSVGSKIAGIICMLVAILDLIVLGVKENE